MSVAKVGVYNRTQSQAIDRMASAYQNASADARKNMAGKKVDIGNGVKLTHRQAYQTQQVMKGNARYSAVRDSEGGFKMSIDKSGNRYMHVRVTGNSSPKQTYKLTTKESKSSYGYASRRASADRTARANERNYKRYGTTNPKRTIKTNTKSNKIKRYTRKNSKRRR